MKKNTLLFALPLMLFTFAGCKWFACCDHHNHGTHTHQNATKTTPSDGAITTITTSALFEEHVLQSKIPVLVDFSADWCGACKAMKSTINEIAQEAQGRYKVVMVNVDKASEIAQKYGIRGIPTFTIFKDGKEMLNEHSRMVGVTEKDIIKKHLESISK